MRVSFNSGFMSFFLLNKMISDNIKKLNRKESLDEDRRKGNDYNNNNNNKIRFYGGCNGGLFNIKGKTVNDNKKFLS